MNKNFNSHRVELSINKLGINGEGVARLDSYTLFVDGALPGEKVTATIEQRKKSYGRARILSIEEPSKNRISPLCSRFNDCGGCQIMHLEYQEQCRQKTALVQDTLRHLGGFDDVDVSPCLASPHPFHYRNKIQLPVTKRAGSIEMGFYRRGSHEIVSYDRCFVHHRSMEESVEKIRQLLEHSGIEPYCEKSLSGSLRHVIIRSNNRGEQLIGLVTTGRQGSKLLKFAQKLMASLNSCIGVVKSVNDKAQNTIIGDKNYLLAGSAFLMEEICGIEFKISLPSFFQVNPGAAQLLYEQALDFAEVDGAKTVLDAYCGIGTLSLISARHAKRVIGIECVEQAIVDAEENARHNNVDNAQFFCGRVEDFVHLFLDVDVAFINPPRKGVDPSVVDALNAFGPKRLVYISCNPATLARDAKMLIKYRLVKAQPVDMFPQTMHVESVVRFDRVA